MASLNRSQDSFSILFPDQGQITWDLNSTTPSVATAILRTLIRVKSEASSDEEEASYDNTIETLKDFLSHMGFPYQEPN
jgi:hypothetical protein